MKRHRTKRVFQLLLLGALIIAIAMRTFRPSSTPQAGAEAVEWDLAAEHIGEMRTVHGPVVQTHYAERSTGSPTFLNLGRPHPERHRFTVVIWGDDRSAFPIPPELKYRGRRVAVSGPVGSHEGIPQIAARGPGCIEILE